LSTSLTLKNIYLDITKVDSISYDTYVWEKVIDGNFVYIKTKTLNYITHFPIPKKNTVIDDYVHTYEFNYWITQIGSEACYDLSSEYATAFKNVSNDSDIYLTPYFNEIISNYSPVKTLRLFVPKEICVLEHTFDYEITEDDKYYILTKTYQKNKYRDENGDLTAIPFDSLPTFRVTDSNWLDEGNWYIDGVEKLEYYEFDVMVDNIDLYAKVTREYTVTSYYKIDYTYEDTLGNLKYVDSLKLGEYDSLGFRSAGYEYVESRQAYYKKLSKTYTVTYGQNNMIGYLPYYTPFNTMQVSLGYYTFDKDVISNETLIASMLSEDGSYYISSLVINKDIDIYASFGMAPDAVEVLLLVDNAFGFDIVTSNGYTKQSYTMTINGKEYQVLRQLFVNNGQTLGDLPQITLKNSEYMSIGFYTSLDDQFAPLTKLHKFTELTTNIVAFSKIQRVDETVKVSLYYDYTEESLSAFSMSDEEAISYGYSKEKVLKDRFFDSTEGAYIEIFELYYYTYAFNIMENDTVKSRVVSRLPNAYREEETFEGWYEKLDGKYTSKVNDYHSYMTAILEEATQITLPTDLTKYINDTYKTDNNEYNLKLYAKFLAYSQLFVYGDISGGTSKGTISYGTNSELNQNTATKVEFKDNTAFTKLMGEDEVAFVIEQGNVDLMYFALDYNFKDYADFNQSYYMSSLDNLNMICQDYVYDLQSCNAGLFNNALTTQYKFVNYAGIYNNLKTLLNDLISGKVQSDYGIISNGIVLESRLTQYIRDVNASYLSQNPTMFSSFGRISFSQNVEGYYYFYFENLRITLDNDNIATNIYPFKLGIDVTKTVGGANYVKYYFSGFKTSVGLPRAILIKVKDVSHKVEIGLTENAISQNQTLTLLQTGEYVLNASGPSISYPFKDSGLEVTVGGIPDGCTIYAKIYYVDTLYSSVGYDITEYGADSPNGVIEYITFGKTTSGTTKIILGEYCNENYKILLEYVMNKYTVNIQSAHTQVENPPDITYGLFEGEMSSVTNWTLDQTFNRYVYGVTDITHGNDMVFNITCQNGYIVKNILASVVGDGSYDNLVINGTDTQKEIIIRAVKGNIN
ncbi:MAG: hypothetical protein IJW82_06680, partial [Clostridia bacterium]|nr:hypothetical protein [Clostridia bacterium]